jgi:hypothetical protein
VLLHNLESDEIEATQRRELARSEDPLGPVLARTAVYLRDCFLLVR